MRYPPHPNVGSYPPGQFWRFHRLRFRTLFFIGGSKVSANFTSAADSAIASPADTSNPSTARENTKRISFRSRSSRKRRVGGLLGIATRGRVRNMRRNSPTYQTLEIGPLIHADTFRRNPTTRYCESSEPHLAGRSAFLHPRISGRPP